jgi:hypothetical protein
MEQDGKEPSMFDETTDQPAGATTVVTAGNAIAQGLTEQAILADIRYFEDKLARQPEPSTSYERAMQRVYASLLAHRRQVLAAFRDGRPEAWYEYEHVIGG